jgi:hypothetical protein
MSQSRRGPRPLPSPQIQLFSDLCQIDHWMPVSCVGQIGLMLEVQSPRRVGRRVPLAAG